MGRRFAHWALILFALTRCAWAGDRWVCLRSAHFELFTASDQKAGRDALLFFEEVRRAFTEILGVKIPEDKPVTIIAFRNEEAFAPYRPQEHVAAYTMSLPLRDFIVMQDLNPEHYPVALHEYTHVVIRQAGMKLPLWLEEGFGEFYSTMKPAGNKILVGRIIPGRLQAAQASLIDLDQVLKADSRSPVYHQNNLVGIFYAESWALVHMLKFSDAYAPRFDRFLDAIGHGQPSDEALQTVYGKTPATVLQDLVRYVHGGRFREGVIKARFEKTGPEPVQVPVDAVDVAVLLAGVEARGPSREEARKTLKQLAEANPERLSPLEALAWVDLAGPDQEAGLAAFRHAFKAGTQDANLCFSFAAKMRDAIPDAEYVAALRRVTEINPGFSTAQQLLAAHAFNAKNYGEAVTRLHLVKKLDRVNAFQYYRALSFAAFQIGDKVEAKAAAARAKQYAVAPEDHRQAEEMLRYVNGGTNAPGFGDNPLPQL
jgi:hypothetical protein